MGNVIPAVCKRESSSFAPGCPIKTFGHDGKWMLMAHSAFALLQALSMGVPPDNIWLSGECTFCNPDKYYSYRYDKGAVGRQYAIAGIAS
jgi:copper oxidase (laccase) domain-containing protein